METNQQNIRIEAIAIFNTILATKQVYSMSYLTKLVRGDRYFDLKKPEHEQLPTFGNLAHLYDYKVKNIMTWLLKNSYLSLTNLKYGSLGLTEKAYTLLQNPTELWVSYQDLQNSMENRVLAESLKRIRKDIAEKLEKPVYEIFTDWSMQTLISEKPKNVAELKLLAVMDVAYVDSYAHLFIRAIELAKSESSIQVMAELQKRVKMSEYQIIKALFLSGYSLDKLGKERQIEQKTVLSYLEDLHKTGEIDMKPWIQRQVNATELDKAATFFQQTQGTFSEAYQVLGLDYQTLRLAKMYISKIEVAQIEI